MEFGSPHLHVREPIVASPNAPPRVRKSLARRHVTVAGDWNLWIQDARWEIKTETLSIRSEDIGHIPVEDACRELDGQILIVAAAGAEPFSCHLTFDLGASLLIWLSPEIEEPQWSIYEAGGRITTCDHRGNISIEGGLVEGIGSNHAAP
jgi:hypothetical protein